MQAGLPSAGRLSVTQAVDELDVGALGRALWRRRRGILALTFLAAAVAFVAVNLITPRYKSESRVLIETRENIFMRPDAEKATERGATVDQEAVTSQVQLILSRDLAREVIRKLKLGEREEFDSVLRGPSIVRVLLGFVGIAKDPISQTPEERVLKSYFDRLAAFQVEKSRVIAIEFESEDPDLSAAAANAIGEVYLSMQQGAKQLQTRAASQWLAGEIENLRPLVADAEAKVEQYRSRSNLFIGANNTTLSNQHLSEFNTQMGAARAQKIDAESKARIIRDTLRSGAPIEFSDVINSELMRRLSEQRVTLRAQLAEQSSTLLGQHPRIKELRAQIADLERQMRLEADSFARSLENDARLASARLDSLNVTLDQLKRQAASTNEQDVELRSLEREAKSQRDLLESYLAKYRETTARDSLGAASPDARIISSALVSNTPSWPKKLPTVLVATLGMFVLSAGFVLTGELLGGGPPPARAAEAVAVPAIDVAPAAAAAAPVPVGVASAVAVAAVERSAASRAPAARAASLPEEIRPVAVPLEAIEALARELSAAGEAARRISVLGARRNIGTTLAAITLARALSKRSRVVLVDLALNAPNLSVVATEPGAPGISELVLGSASFGQIITRDKFSGVHVITAGHEMSHPDALLSSQRLSITLEALGRSYDHVVIDAGALPELVAARFARLAQRAVLIADVLDDPETAAARERLIAAGFASVNVLVSMPRGPLTDASGTRAAA